MALPNLPVQGTNPWYAPRNAWDVAVAADLETRVKANTLSVLAPAATGTDQTAALTSALSSAATFGLWLQLSGNYVITGQILPVTGAKLDGTGGSITQTTNLKSAIQITSKTNVRIKNLRLLGKTTDYVNNSSVYLACAVGINGTSSDIVIDNCQFLGWAGAGVYATGTCSNLRISNTVMTGAGPTYILNNTYNFSGGVIIDPNITDWTVRNCDISAFSQGVVTGDNIASVQIMGNLIHDIPGQHGLYLESMLGGIVADNIIWNCALSGMKIQIGTVGAIDTKNVKVDNNVIRNVGAQGILLTNPVGGTPRFREMAITGNAISSATGGGIEVNNCVGVHISDNTVFASSFGMRVQNSSQVTVDSGQLSGLTLSGLAILSSQDVSVDSVRIKDVGSASIATDQFGIRIDGPTTDSLSIRSVKITDANSKMTSGIYVIAGVSTGMDFIDNDVSGGTYGWRLQTAGAVRTFRGNRFAGSTGAYLNPPTNFVQIANPTDAATTQAAVVALLPILRDIGVIRA